VWLKSLWEQRKALSGALGAENKNRKIEKKEQKRGQPGEKNYGLRTTGAPRRLGQGGRTKTAREIQGWLRAEKGNGSQGDGIKITKEKKSEKREPRGGRHASKRKKKLFRKSQGRISGRQAQK